MSTRLTTLATPRRFVLASATGGLVALASAATALLVLTGTSAVSLPPAQAPPLPGPAPIAGAPGVVVLPTPDPPAVAAGPLAPRAARQLPAARRQAVVVPALLQLSPPAVVPAAATPPAQPPEVPPAADPVPAPAAPAAPADLPPSALRRALGSDLLHPSRWGQDEDDKPKHGKPKHGKPKHAHPKHANQAPTGAIGWGLSLL